MLESLKETLKKLIGEKKECKQMVTRVKMLPIVRDLWVLAHLGGYGSIISEL